MGFFIFMTVEQTPEMPKGLAEMHTAWFHEDLLYPERVLPESVPIREYLESERVRGELEKLARVDQLTGLLNRHGLDEKLKQLFEENEQFPGAITALSLDLNEFKNINDTYGHAEGDQVMQRWVYQIKANLQQGDIFARSGGDEFVIIRVHSKDEVVQAQTHGVTICDVTDEMGQGLAHGMNDSIITSTKDGYKPITASVGGVCIIEPNNIGEIYHGIGKRSDEAMYKAKRAAKSEKTSARIHGVVPSTYYRQTGEDLNTNFFSAILSRITHARTGIFSRR